LKISILLPLKENFSPDYPGAVSLFINDTQKISKFNKDTIIYGNTKFLKRFNHKYINLKINKKIFSSQNKEYVNSFIDKEKKRNSDLIEIHNRPIYIKYLVSNFEKKKYILYFHNDPLSMAGSKSIEERLFLINKCSNIIFNSKWSKNQFLKDLFINNFDLHKKLLVINQSASKKKINLKIKKNIITFVGKLNVSKGYDIFGEAIIKILNKHKNWSSIVCGDEPRSKLEFNHVRLNKLGFVNHKKVLNIYKKTSIAVVCSRWEEPFGRTSLEAASNGCCVIISNRGGLPETITDGVVLKNLSTNELIKSIDKLIKNSQLRRSYQEKSLKNFYLTHQHVTNLIDNVRNSLNNEINYFYINKNNLKIINIYNIGQKSNHRLYNISIGKKFTNGFIRNNHDVLEISDRDFIRQNRGINLFNTQNLFQQYLLETFKNYSPDLIIFGHSENINIATLNQFKEIKKNIIISHWNEDPMMKSVPDSENNLNKIIKFNQIVDHSFVTTDPKVLKERNKNLKNINFFFIPVDKNIETYNVYNMSPKKDLFYAMSHGVNRAILKRGKTDERVLFLNKLVKKLKNIDYDFYGYNGAEPIWGNKFYNALTNCSMGLNLSRGNPTKYYTSNRIASLMGNGQLTFIDKKTKINEIFNSNEAIFYNSIKDLSEKISFYKRNKKLANKIAKKGKEKYFKLFNEKKISKYLIDKSLGKNSILF